jgi:exodeoxyribonuclease-5
MHGNISEEIRKRFPHEPTPGQSLIITALERFLLSDKPKCTFLIRGYAGTGKTTLLGALVRAMNDLGKPVILMAPTGRAAKVMSSRSGDAASTLHKRIYLRKYKPGVGMAYSLAPNTVENGLFIVDESSMIGGRGLGSSEAAFEYRNILTDLLSYVFSGKNCRLLLLGDTAQLPPVGSDYSPAMDLTLLQREFHLTIASFELTEVVRQAENSGILFNATALREKIRNSDYSYPGFVLNSFTDIVRVQGSELQEYLEDAYRREGPEGVCVITRSNKRANLFNRQIRSRVFWQDEEIEAGDLVMVVKNNYHWISGMTEFPCNFIANGDTAEILKVVKREELYELRFAEVMLRLSDYPDAPPIQVKIILDTLSEDGPSLNAARMRKLFEEISSEYTDLGDPAKIRSAVLENPYFNALQIKFAYAVTCHKAQGGQWPEVFIDQGYLTEEMLNLEFLRWLYTAFTRATGKLFLVNFSDSFFQESQPSG